MTKLPKKKKTQEDLHQELKLRLCTCIASTESWEAIGQPHATEGTTVYTSISAS